MELSPFLVTSNNFRIKIYVVEIFLRSVETNVLDGDMVLNESELLSCYYHYFQSNSLGKSINPHKLYSYGLSSAPFVLLQEGFRLKIIRWCWYAFKPNKPMFSVYSWGHTFMDTLLKFGHWLFQLVWYDIKYPRRLRGCPRGVMVKALDCSKPVRAPVTL